MQRPIRIHTGPRGESRFISAIVKEALHAKEEGKEKVMLFNWSGHGLVDIASYDSYLSGKLTIYELPEEDIRRALKTMEKYPKPWEVF